MNAIQQYYGCQMINANLAEIYAKTWVFKIPRLKLQKLKPNIFTVNKARKLRKQNFETWS